MSKTQDRMIAGFTAGERDYIRRELDMFFSTLPSVADGFQLKTWRSGPDAGQPKLPHQIKEALRRRDNGEPMRDIARSYNISHSTISRLG